MNLWIAGFSDVLDLDNGTQVAYWSYGQDEAVDYLFRQYKGFLPPSPRPIVWIAHLHESLRPKQPGPERRTVVLRLCGFHYDHDTRCGRCRLWSMNHIVDYCSECWLCSDCVTICSECETCHECCTEYENDCPSCK